MLFGILYLLRFDYSNAEEFFVRIPVHRKEKLRSDLQRVKLLIEILIKLNDKQQAAQFIDGEIDKVYDRLSEWEGLSPHEGVIIKYFRRWNKLPAKTKRELTPLFEDFKEALAATIDDTGFLPLASEIISSWLDQKLDN